jgi:hypothetical protein
MKTWFVMLASIAMVASCSRNADSAQGIAERFVDEHYVRMDLERAKAMCVGVAREKVEEMQGLIGGEKIDESTHKPRVSYELEKTTADAPDRASFLFRGKIKADGLDEFTRHWLVTTRLEEGAGWRVSNFQEFE